MMNIPLTNLSRRSFLSAAAAGIPAAFAQRVSRRPNIVLLLADDLGWGDLSSYGAPDVRTPHIDSLGRTGVRFTAFYDNGRECSPTRCSLMTGRYQQRVGAQPNMASEARRTRPAGFRNVDASNPESSRIRHRHVRQMAPRLPGEV